MNKGKRLVFIYNLESSPIEQALDMIYRITAPATFKCNLYKLTQEYFNMKYEWKNFIKEMPIDFKFYHRDMFKKKYPDFKSEYPIVLLENDGRFETFINPEEIIGITSLQELKDLIKQRLSK